MRETRAAAKGLKPNGDGRLTIGPAPGLIHLVVTRPLLRRALLIAHAICSEAESRGWEIADHDGIAIGVRGHTYPLKIYELTETLPFTEEEIIEWRERRSWLGRRETGDPPPQMKRKRATGRLAIHMSHGYRGGRAKWTEGPRGPLEGKLASVFAVLEQRAVEDDEHERKAAETREQFRLEQEAREKRARLQRIDQARSDRLVREAGAWERSAQIRRYIAALRERAQALDSPERERVLEWCDWSADWAERSGPVRFTELIVGFDDRNESHQPTGARYARFTRSLESSP